MLHITCRSKFEKNHIILLICDSLKVSIQLPYATLHQANPTFSNLKGWSNPVNNLQEYTQTRTLVFSEMFVEKWNCWQNFDFWQQFRFFDKKWDFLPKASLFAGWKNFTVFVIPDVLHQSNTVYMTIFVMFVSMTTNYN